MGIIQRVMGSISEKWFPEGDVLFQEELSALEVSKEGSSEGSFDFRRGYWAKGLVPTMPCVSLNTVLGCYIKVICVPVFYLL